MSALCQKRTLRILLDHLVGAQEECLWDLQPQCFGDFQVHKEFELGWLLNWDFARLSRVQNLVTEVARTPPQARKVCSIGHKPARLDVVSVTVDRRQSRV